MQQSLRSRLRAQTRDAHDEVDRCYSAYDVAEFAGYIGFLQAQDAALIALISHNIGRAHLGAMMRADHARIVRDFQALGVARQSACLLTVKPCHPIALEYILRGSRQGHRVVQRRWLRSDDPRVRSAGCYLSAPCNLKDWHAFCARLDRMPAKGAVGDRIVADTRKLFDLYARAARAQICTTEAVFDVREPFPSA